MSSAQDKVINIPSAQANPLKIRFVTAASLFDGHDAAINIMRRILQSSGAEVIHLGHNRSVAEIVDAAVQEDAQAIGPDSAPTFASSPAVAASSYPPRYANSKPMA
jgi:methylmalonyl-CoA mutase